MAAGTAPEDGRITVLRLAQCEGSHGSRRWWFMPINARRDRGIQGIGWLAAGAGASLVISVGLELFAHQLFGQTSLATFILAIYLGFWSCVLGIFGVLILSLRWLLEWRRERGNRAAITRYAPAEPRLRRPTKPGLKDAHVFAPSRSSTDIEAKDQSNSCTRVA